MTGPAPDIPHDSLVVIDSSVLFAIGGPTNEKYQAVEQYVTRRDITVKVPERVAEELGESPDAYAYQRDRLRAAQEAGWVEPARVDFSQPRVSAVVDKTCTRMLNLSADDVSEHEIEKTDTVLTGLAYQYATGGASHVTVLVSDTIAEQAIDDVLSAASVGDATTVVDGRAFLKALTAAQLD